jgi:hypothetical protein
MEGRKFVAQQSQDDVTGRLMREYIESTKLVDDLESEVSIFRDLHRRLGSALNRPLLIRFDDEPDVSPLPYSAFRQGDLRFSCAEINGERLKMLCDSLRLVTAKHKDLVAQLEKCGIRVGPLLDRG